MPAHPRLLPVGRILWLALALLWLASVPRGRIARGPSSCLFKHLLGLEWFGCGMTRALLSVLPGNMAAALSDNTAVFT